MEVKNENMDIQEPSEDLPKRRCDSFLRVKNTLLASLAAYMYTISSGMLVSYTAPATVDMNEPGSRLRGITTEEITWIASLLNISSGVGNVAAGYLTQKFGRRTVLLCISLPYVIAWVMIAYASSVYWIYAARIIHGLCYGSCSVTVPTYIVEIAPTNIRGMLTSLYHVFITTGVLIMVSLGYVLRWSWMAVAGAALITVANCIMYFMPESPPWLLNKSRNAEAGDAIRFLWGKETDVEKAIEDIVGKTTEQPTIVWRDIFKPELYKPILIGCSLAFFCQAAGIATITAYTVNIFKDIGSPIDAQTSTFFLSVVHVLSAIACSLSVEKVGRKVLYVCSGALLTTALAILGTYTFLAALGFELSKVEWIPLVDLNAYYAFFSLGYGTIPIVVISEIVTVQSRSLVLAIAVISSSIFTFAVTKSYEFLVANVGYYGLFWIYGSLTFMGTLFGWYLLPETKGKSTAELNKYFSNYKSINSNGSCSH